MRPADDVAPAEWIGRACHGELGTVGALVPNHYQCVLRVDAPAPSPGDWWSMYRDLFGVVASIGQRHTSTPDSAWFAIWEGHGFPTGVALQPAQRARFERPHRVYYLMTGRVASATTLRFPDVHEWRNPDLFWPDDRRWFVATDVDFWSLYVAGDSIFVDELAAHVPTRTALVPLDASLPLED